MRSGTTVTCKRTLMSQLLLMSVQILKIATLGGIVGGIGGLVGVSILSTTFRWQGDAPLQRTNQRQDAGARPGSRSLKQAPSTRSPPLWPA